MIRSSVSIQKSAVARLRQQTTTATTAVSKRQSSLSPRITNLRNNSNNNNNNNGYMLQQGSHRIISRSRSSLPTYTTSIVVDDYVKLSRCVHSKKQTQLYQQFIHVPVLPLRNHIFSSSISSRSTGCSGTLLLHNNSRQQHRTFFSFGRNADKPPSTPSSMDGTAAVASGSNPNNNNDDDDADDDHLTTITSDTTANATPSVDETLNKLFAEQSNTGTTSSSSDAWYTTAESAADASTVWDPTWYNVADNAILSINYIQHVTGLPYGVSIIAATALLRVTLFPLMVQAQRAASRMAYVQPELQVLKDRYERISAPTRTDQMQFSTNMKALFAKYKVNPFQTMIAPLVQVPLFIGMFFGLKKVATYFPEELKVGGMFWFVDLSIPDPYYALPLISSATFLLLVELGKDQMLRAGGSSVMMLNVFRFMCIVSLPLVVNFEAAMLLYWVTNNLLTCAQTVILKAPVVRKQFGILDPPRPAAGADPEKDGIVASVTDLVKRAQGKAVTEADKIQKHNREIEAKNVSTRFTRVSQERDRRRRTGITGTRNY